MLLQIGIQLILPIVLFIILWRVQYKNWIRWLTETLLFSLIIIFVFFTARWDITSYYLRILILPIFTAAGYFAFRRIKSDQSELTFSEILKEYGISIVLIGVLIWLNVNAARGIYYEARATELEFPLRGGIYYIGGGGSSRWINNHNAFPPQDYALDIVRLNILGRNSSFGIQAELDNYEIYGDPIYSPCSGSVGDAVDGIPDQIPPNKDTVNVAGNYVLIICEDVEILLAHMKPGSIKVSIGDDVQVGERIGVVGNSGHSSQPHLHIHAEQGGEDGKILNGNGVPITFGNQFLVRNDLYIATDSSE